jgi:hypothetical protein
MLALAHFAEWEDVPNPERLSEKEMPYGAFILALQAVRLPFLKVLSFLMHIRFSMP